MATSTYAYKVRDTEGQVLEGQIDADSPALVANRLREMGFALISIEEEIPARDPDIDSIIIRLHPHLNR